jgi:hypothetical protein
MCEACGAFVPSAARLPASPARTQLPARAPTCALRRNLDDVVPSRAAGSAVRSVGVAAAAALIVSSQCMHHVLGRDNALVFDHDQTLVGADFTGRTDLVNSIFSKSNCTRANFSRANLKNAQLDDTVLIEAILDDAGIYSTILTKAQFKTPLASSALALTINVSAVHVSLYVVTSSVSCMLLHSM